MWKWWFVWSFQHESREWLVLRVRHSHEYFCSILLGFSKGGPLLVLIPVSQKDLQLLPISPEDTA